MAGMKQRYERTYEGGRATNGWGKGERIRKLATIKPGDVLLNVCHQFQAENLIRVVPLPAGFIDIPGRGFYYEYVDCRTLERSDGDTMFCWYWEVEKFDGREFYRMRDQRPPGKPDTSKRRIRADKLPAWLSYQTPNSKASA